MPVKADHLAADAPVKVGAAHDPAEANADQLAGALVAPTAQPLACSACAAGDAPCPACAGGASTLRRKALADAPTGSPMPTAVGEAVSGPAAPLPDATRRHFEHRLGTDLGALRLHTGSAAARAADSVGARAFALGCDIVFGAGEFRPDTRDGQHLIAHEVAHVVQDGPGGTLRRKPSAPPDPAKDASDDEQQLKKMQLLPESNFINGAASVGGLKAWQTRYPLSYEEMKKRAVGVYGEAGYERLLAADGQVLPLVQKSEMLMTRLTALRDRYDAEDESAHKVIDAYGGTNYLVGENVRGWFDLDYDWLGQQYAKYDNFDLGLFQALLSEDVDTLIERVAENADAAKLEADEEKARKEGWIEDGADVLGSVVARRDDVFFDDEISLESVLDPPEGSDKANEMLAVARYAGRMSAVVKVKERYYAYSLSEDFDQSNVFWGKDLDAYSRVVPAGPLGGAVVALTTTSGLPLKGEDGGRFKGGDQTKNPEAYLDTDTEMLTSGKADALGVSPSVMFRSMVRNLALVNLKQAEANLQGIENQMKPDFGIDPAAGAALQKDTARLRQLSVQAASLAVEIGDGQATEEQVDRRDALLSEMGTINQRSPAAALMVKSSRKPDDQDPVEDGQIKDTLADKHSGDAAMAAVNEARSRKANIDKVRAALFNDPDFVLGLDVLHDAVLAYFPEMDRLRIKAELVFNTIASVAGTIGLLGIDLALLVAGFFTGGLTWPGLMLHGAGTALGLAQAGQQIKHAQMVDAMSELDVEGGFQLATPEQAKSARNWALIGSALSFLSVIGLARTGAKLLAATQRETNLVGRIARQAGVTEDVIAGALRKNWRGIPNPDKGALRSMVLAKLPEPLAQRYRNLAIEVLSEEDWARLYGPKSASHAATEFTRNAAGQLVPTRILFRRNGNIFALHEEATHIAQAADNPELANKIEAVSNLSKGMWAAKSLPEKLRAVRGVLEVELDAQERILAQAQQAGDTESMDDAFAAMESLSIKLAEVDQSIANPASRLPGWFDAAEIPSIFASPRLPRSRGSWSGAPGNSIWKSTNPKVKAIVGNKGVRFSNGYPDFREYSIGQVNIGQTGHAGDFAEADMKFAEGIANGTRKPPEGYVKADFMHNGQPVAAGTERFRRAAGYTWHHHQGGNQMMLVPTKLHANVPHTGGASAARAGGP